MNVTAQATPVMPTSIPTAQPQEFVSRFVTAMVAKHGALSRQNNIIANPCSGE